MDQLVDFPATVRLGRPNKGVGKKGKRKFKSSRQARRNATPQEVREKEKKSSDQKLRYDRDSRFLQKEDSRGRSAGAELQKMAKDNAQIFSFFNTRYGGYYEYLFRNKKYKIVDILKILKYYREIPEDDSDDDYYSESDDEYYYRCPYGVGGCDGPTECSALGHYGSSGRYERDLAYSGYMYEGDFIQYP